MYSNIGGGSLSSCFCFPIHADAAMLPKKLKGVDRQVDEHKQMSPQKIGINYAILAVFGSFPK